MEQIKDREGINVAATSPKKKRGFLNSISKNIIKIEYAAIALSAIVIGVNLGIEAMGKRATLRFDEQRIAIFERGASHLEFDVNAKAVAESDGIGPVYLVNGLSDKGYWYQVGLAYNPYIRHKPTYIDHSSYHIEPGFRLICEVFSKGGSDLPEFLNGAHVIRFPDGGIKNGDTVRLSLRFEHSRVMMQARDLNNRVSASESVNAFGAKRFVGSPLNKVVGRLQAAGGMYTSVMTEEYHTKSESGLGTYNEMRAVYPKKIGNVELVAAERPIYAQGNPKDFRKIGERALRQEEPKKAMRPDIYVIDDNTVSFGSLPSLLRKSHTRAEAAGISSARESARMRIRR